MKKLLTIIGVLAALSVIVYAVYAAWIDQASVPENVVTTEQSIDISTSPVSAAIVAPDLGPGEQVTSQLDVNNTGGALMYYGAVSTTTENTLAAGLEFTIKDLGTSCVAFDGATVYGPAAFGSMAGTALFSDRTVDASGSESLCLRIALPVGADPSLGGLTTTATFVFDASSEP